MSEFQIPSLDEIHELLIADYQARFPGAAVSRFADNWKRLRTTAIAVASLHEHIDQIYDDLLPDGAEDTRLDRLGAIWRVTRKPETVSTGTDALRLTGTASSTFTSGDELVHSPTGLRYQLTESGAIPAGGQIDVDVASIDTGAKTRLQALEVLTFSAPPAGVNAAAELQADLEGGDDEEADGPYRQRILDRIAQPGMGGNAEDYRQWAIEVTGIVAAFVYSGRNGGGSVDVVALKTGTGTERIPSGDEVTKVQNYIDAKRPVSVRDFRVLTVTSQSQAVEVTLLPESPDVEFDWDDSTSLVVSTWTGATRVLKFTTARPSDMLAGHRLIIDSAAADGSESVIEVLGPGADEVTLQASPAWTPASPDIVYAGGPLVAPARAAIIAHIDSLGPARGTTAALAWKGVLATANLFRVVQLLAGVLDSTLVTPAVNVTPVDTPPNPDTALLIAGQILVRRSW